MLGSPALQSQFLNDRVRRHLAWALLVAPFMACCGGESERDPMERDDPAEPEPEEPEVTVSECREENSEAECEFTCHLPSSEPVAAGCFLVAAPGQMPLNCSCEGGPSDGTFFSLSSCDELLPSIESVCAQTSPAPPCPTVVPASGQACSHRQTCLIEDFSADCSAGQHVRSRSLNFVCSDGVWKETGVQEEFCP
ncbi:MAG TPA: hypothetical protein VFU02_07475 [Polyangiaceae bacterium]|nr:hypothetical protein [Polyangiaceae bacterium]